MNLATWVLKQVDADRSAATACRAKLNDIEPMWHLIVTANMGNSRGGPAIDHQEFIQAHLERWKVDRVLAECDAKRQMLDQIFQYEAKIDGEWGCCHDADQIREGRCADIPVDDIAALRILAQPFAQRPGYREEWRP